MCQLKILKLATFCAPECAGSWRVDEHTNNCSTMEGFQTELACDQKVKKLLRFSVYIFFYWFYYSFIFLFDKCKLFYCRLMQQSNALVLPILLPDFSCTTFSIISFSLAQSLLSCRRYIFFQWLYKPCEIPSMMFKVVRVQIWLKYLCCCRDSPPVLLELCQKWTSKYYYSFRFHQLKPFFCWKSKWRKPTKFEKQK